MLHISEMKRTLQRVFRGRFTHTYVSIINESVDKCPHVLTMLSSLQQEQHIHGLLTRHCAKKSQINTGLRLLVD